MLKIFKNIIVYEEIELI